MAVMADVLISICIHSE